MATVGNPTTQERQRRSELAAKQATARPRDAHGHFLPAGRQVSSPTSAPTSNSQLCFCKSKPVSFLALFALIFVLLVFFAGFLLGRWQVLSRDIPATRLGILKISTNTKPPKYLLLETSGRVFTLILPTQIDTASLRNRRVLVSGLLNEADSLIRVTKPENIEPVPAYTGK